MDHHRRPVSFVNGVNSLVGTVHEPDRDLHPGPWPALVVATPGSSVKEQIAANYAGRLAPLGFLVLTFDPSHQGQSGGEPRDLEDPSIRVEDLRCAVDHLITDDAVDPTRIGVLGICAGGGYAVNAALTERRFRAVGVVAPVNIGRSNRQGGGLSPDGVETRLRAAGDARSAEARTGEQPRQPWIPDTPEEAVAAGITDPDVLEAVDFYRTTRGHHEQSTNRRLVRSNAPLIAFDAFHLVPELLTQPLKVVVGGRRGSTGSYEDGLLVWERARHKAPLTVVAGAGHYEMYDHPGYVDQAVSALATFFQDHLGAPA